MYELKKNGKVLTSKSVGTRPSSYEKRIYRAAVSQRLRNTALDGKVTDPQLYSPPPQNITRCPLNRKLGGTNSLSGRLAGHRTTTPRL